MANGLSFTLGRDSTARPSVPVMRLDESGSITDDPVMGRPCIRLGYSFAPPVERSGRFELEGIKYVIGLIDTGADINLLDEALFDETVGESVQRIKGIGYAGNASDVDLYKITLWMPEVQVMQNSGVGKWCRGHTNPPPYQMILGRKFLQCVRFTYDGTNGITSFVPFHNPRAI
jgi:hypothetical protein